MTPANLLTQWSRLLLSSLADAGVRDVVLSPGSRSSPFMLAAEAEPRLRCHDSIDERAGAFFALGQARVTGRPSLLLCTSGTAAAHYLPAVIEASLAHLPLVVLTADRPLELQDCGAPQTIDQMKLMGDYARRFYELGTPDPAPSALTGVRRLAAQAVHFSRSPVPGPVHLNARARKPLEPHPAQNEGEQRLEAAITELLERPLATAHPPVERSDPDAVSRVAGRCATTERGLIVAGPIAVTDLALREAAYALARATGYPLLPEAASQLRLTAVPDGVVVCDAFNALLRSRAFREAHRPDVLIVLGGVPVSAGWEQYVAAHDRVDTVIVSRHGWQDPQSTATDLLLGDPALVVAELAAALPTPAAAPTEWAQAFAQDSEAVWRVVDDELAEGDRLGEGRAVRVVVGRLPLDSLLMLGNSLPIREVDTFCRAGTADVRVLSQRGTNGIDGLVAGAAGSAVADGGRLALIIGDVSLLHDLTGLALAGRGDAPLVIVVLQNRGGRIFELLPLADAPGVSPAALAHVTTPHDFALEHAARLFRHRYALAETAGELARALDAAYEHPGCTVIEVVVTPSGAAEQHRRIFAAVDAAAQGLEVR